MTRAVAIDLDGALGDTWPLWRDFLADAALRFASIAELDPALLPDDRAAAADELDRWAERGIGDWRAALTRFAEDRAPVYLRPNAEASAAAADELDRWAERGIGDWRAALTRFAEDRAPVYLRPNAEASAALRSLAAAGYRLGAFTDAPEPLARVALAQLGAMRRLEALTCGRDARARLLERLGADAAVVSTPDDLAKISVRGTEDVGRPPA